MGYPLNLFELFTNQQDKTRSGAYWARLINHTNEREELAMSVGPSYFPPVFSFPTSFFFRMGTFIKEERRQIGAKKSGYLVVSLGAPGVFSNHWMHFGGGGSWRLVEGS